jgi:hypothetical protein
MKQSPKALCLCRERGEVSQAVILQLNALSNSSAYNFTENRK